MLLSYLRSIKQAKLSENNRNLPPFFHIFLVNNLIYEKIYRGYPAKYLSHYGQAIFLVRRNISATQICIDFSHIQKKKKKRMLHICK